MASNMCWHCLARVRRSEPWFWRVDRAANSAPTRHFSTSPSPLSPSARKHSSGVKKQLQAKPKTQSFLKPKSSPRSSGTSSVPTRTPVEKSRRIVLSNTNALEVKDMQELNPQTTVEKGSVGRVLGIPGTVVDQLRAVEAFRRTQAWDMFRRPAILMRQETMELAQLMAKIEQDKSTTRRIVTGDHRVGKTAMLLQAMALAFVRGWVVINLPKAHDLTHATTAYAPTTSSLPSTYTQPTYTASLLSTIARSNPILSTLTLSGTHTLLPSSAPASPTDYVSPLPPLPENTSLAQLCTLGSTDPEAAWPTFTLLMKELLLPGRPPVLFCLDNLHQAMTMSRYRNADYGLVHAHELELVKWFMDALAGETGMGNGGVVMAATSKAGDSPHVDALDWCLERLERGEGVGEGHPYGKFDERVMRVFGKEGLEVQRLRGLSEVEARGLLEYWARSGVFPQLVDQERVDREMVLSGGGVIGELERGCLRTALTLKE